MESIQIKGRDGENDGSYISRRRGTDTLQEEKDLYYAMNDFYMWSDGGFKIDCNIVTINPTYQFFDNYNWHPQLGNAGGVAPGVAGLRDEWALALADAGIAKTYEIYGYWKGREKVIYLPTNWINIPIDALKIYN